MYGWQGRILFIDLSRQSSHAKSLSEEQLQSEIGGRGLAISLFQDFAHLDPFDPEVPLIFTTGPLSGTRTPATERICVLSRSPLTGTVFDTSSGGSFARALKATGHDGLFITGQSERPLAISIRQSKVSFIPAESLWGKSTSETLSAFSAQGAAVIGPAGEKGVLYANIVFSDGDNDNRGGLGAIMGGKSLKALLVEGEQPTTIADSRRLQNAHRDILRLYRASPALLGQFGLHEYGSSTFVDLTNQRGMLPTRNFSASHFISANKISGPAIRRTLGPEHDTCYDCPIACKKLHADFGRLPEYSALSHFGALLGISDLNRVLTANAICRELGLDPISAAVTLATRSEITGEYPAAEALPDILTGVTDCSSPDHPLAQGSRRLAETLGRPDVSMTVKSLELPAFDPRGAIGMALSYCTSTLGGTHVRAHMEATEILRKPVAVDRLSYSGKARLLKNAEDVHAAADSMIICHNALCAASLEEYAEAVAAVTGVEYSLDDLTRRGASIIKAEFKINRDNGFSAHDDKLPERFFNKAEAEINHSSPTPLFKKDFEEELIRYYKIRGLSGDLHSEEER